MIHVIAIDPLAVPASIVGLFTLCYRLVLLSISICRRICVYLAMVLSPLSSLHSAAAISYNEITYKACVPFPRDLSYQ